MNQVKLTNESCFDFFPKIADKSIDLVLIDPPYDISRDTGFAGGEPKGTNTDRFRISMDFGAWDKNIVDMNKVIKECFRVLKNSGTIICFYDIWKISYLKEYMENAGFTQLRFIEWVKTDPVPINSKCTYLSNAREIAVTAVKKGKSTFHSEYDNGIYKYGICHDPGRFHPTQKPVKLIAELIEKHSNIGDTVLDCFSGSGTTAVASYMADRNFVGCELNEDYYTKSMLRLNELTTNLFLGGNA